MPLNPVIRISAALLIVFVACGGLVQPEGLSASATNGAIVQAGSGVVQSPGKPVVLPVTVANVQKLGATTVLVSYDPASVTVAACQRNTAFDVGLCNAAYDRNADGTADAVLFNLVSLQGVSAGETPVVLVNVAWQAAADVQPPAYSDLAVQVQTFTDADANPLTVTAQGGRITVEVGPTPVPARYTYLPLMLR